MRSEAMTFRRLCAKNYKDRFKLLYVIEENLIFVDMWFIKETNRVPCTNTMYRLAY